MAFVTGVRKCCIGGTSGLLSLTWLLVWNSDRTMRLQSSPIQDLEVLSRLNRYYLHLPHRIPILLGGVTHPNDRRIRKRHPPRTPFDTFHHSIPRNGHNERMRTSEQAYNTALVTRLISEESENVEMPSREWDGIFDSILNVRIPPKRLVNNQTYGHLQVRTQGAQTSHSRDRCSPINSLTTFSEKWVREVRRFTGETAHLVTYSLQTSLLKILYYSSF